MIFSVSELAQLLVASAVLSYIFTSFVKPSSQDVFSSYKRFDWKSFRYAASVAVPSVILHEFGHKFIALALGLDAHFQAWGLGLVLGLVLKFIGSGFLLLAPGYVIISNVSGPLSVFLTSFSGPFVNLVFWLGSLAVLRYHKNLKEQYLYYFGLFATVNKWLFLFNMLPIPPLDGSKVFLSLWQLLF